MKQNEIKSGDKWTGKWGSLTFEAMGVLILRRVKRKIPKPKKERGKVVKGTKKMVKKKKIDESDEIDVQEILGDKIEDDFEDEEDDIIDDLELDEDDLEEYDLEEYD